VGNRVGSARVSGCDKDGKNSGVVVEIGQGDNELTATAYAHELAHFLGVEAHSSDQNNLMFSGQNGRQLNEGQAVKILTHCFVTECSDLP
jgi:predicted Zn-dependent protease